MTLWGSSINNAYGAIRNTNLAKIVFPGWKIHIYAEDSMRSTVYPPVPKRILLKLQSLGAHIRHVSAAEASQVPPCFWHYLVADDVNVSHFLVRNVCGRLTDRDAAAVSSWLHSTAALHCLRDHPQHVGLRDGLWGSRRQQLVRILDHSMKQLIINYLKSSVFNDQQMDSNYSTHQNHHIRNFTGSSKIHKLPSNSSYCHSDVFINEFLNNILWSKFNVQGSILCHDSVSCGKDSLPFPLPRYGHEYVGQYYDAWGIPDLQGIKAMHDKGNEGIECEND